MTIIAILALLAVLTAIDILAARMLYRKVVSAEAVLADTRDIAVDAHKKINAINQHIGIWLAKPMDGYVARPSDSGNGCGSTPMSATPARK